ncbi:peptidylprolyl isomerase [Candidatus Gracilibacteria bacterium]|nr:peptidylprolyl isomerase [Candidatus Gracilibacteria bacterium]
MGIFKIFALMSLIFFAPTNVSDTTNVSDINNLPNNEIYMGTKKLENGDKVAIITTNKGKIEIFLETKKAPVTTNNFIGLAKDGYYDGVIFHRVIKDFMIQGGDPDGTGMGGKSIYGEKFEDEFVSDLKNNKYTISMANAGPNTNGSQFFINVKDNNFLDGKHSVFGEVVDGVKNVDAIVKVKTGAQDRPEKEVKMIKVEVKEYKDGKLVDFDFDKEKAIQEYQTYVKEKAQKEAQAKKEEMERKKDLQLKVGNTAVIEFTIKKEDGSEYISTTNQLPIVEKAEMLSGLNDGIKGMKIGEEKTLTLKPQEAFGEYKEEYKKEIPKADLKSFEDAGIKLEVGSKLPTQVGELEIVEDKGDAVVVDTNVPLAGQTITIDVKVVDIL